jgi:hypothetical protein
MTHPYSIYVWHPSRLAGGRHRWYEAFQAYTEDDALYTANLIHMDSKAVIKVVRYGLNLACFPDEHTVQLCELQIARQREPRHEVEEPDITLL